MQYGIGVLWFNICIWLCAAIFVVIGVWALCRKTPMHFWSGSTVSIAEIRDIRRYNRANGRMWILFGVGMALIGFLGFWSIAAAGVCVSFTRWGEFQFWLFYMIKFTKKIENFDRQRFWLGPKAGLFSLETICSAFAGRR